MFENRKAQTVLTTSVTTDLLLLIFVITPAFVIGMRFASAPCYLNYRRRLNSLIVVPLIGFLFLANH